MAVHGAAQKLQWGKHVAAQRLHKASMWPHGAQGLRPAHGCTGAAQDWHMPADNTGPAQGLHSGCTGLAHGCRQHRASTGAAQWMHRASMWLHRACNYIAQGLKIHCAGTANTLRVACIYIAKGLQIHSAGPQMLCTGPANTLLRASIWLHRARIWLHRGCTGQAQGLACTEPALAAQG